MIFNKLQLITNYLDVGFIVRFYCLLTYSLQISSCSLAYSVRIASCYIYNVILKFQKNDKKLRHKMKFKFRIIIMAQRLAIIRSPI
jgi:hypothetical protein